MSTKRKIHPIIKSLIPIVETSGKMFGKNCEVVLHDFSGPQHSIIAIENGHVTGRKVGDPITDLALASWRQGGFGPKKEDRVLNYKTKTKDGRILKSSSVFIKDEKNNIIGCLCFNYDLTGYLMFENIMKEFCSINELNNEKEETFIKDVDEILDNLINKAIEKIHKPISLMQKEDNLRVVENFDEKGGFMIKGAVDQLAHKLNVSRFTIYNYLDEIKIKKRNKK
jgi:predicted transcriptional regulator YheO